MNIHIQRDVIQTDLIFPMVTFSKTVEQHHNQDGNSETIYLSYSQWWYNTPVLSTSPGFHFYLLMCTYVYWAPHNVTSYAGSWIYHHNWDTIQDYNNPPAAFFGAPPHTRTHPSPTPLLLATNLPSISKIFPCVICHPYVLFIFFPIFYLCFNWIGSFKVQFWEFIIHSRY